MHNVVIQAGQDKIASLEGIFSTSCLDVLVFFLFGEDMPSFETALAAFVVFFVCCTVLKIR